MILDARLHPVTIYTDGGADPNPGRGGYGVVLLSGENRRELSGAFDLTTNNRMELMAVIVGLKALKRPSVVLVRSDSKYVVETFTSGAAKRWKANGWYISRKKKAKNADLWDKLLTACEANEVRFEWVRGHSSVPENERCDELATDAIRTATAEIDKGYLEFLKPVTAQLNLFELDELSDDEKS